MSENSFGLDGGGVGPSHVRVYVQHGLESEQSTGIMVMNGDDILFQLDARGIKKFISELSSRWQGTKPHGLL